MTTVYIAYGQVDYEGRDTIGVFDNEDEAMYRCRGIECLRAIDDDFDCFYSVYWIETWTVGNTTYDERLYLTRKDLQ